jgi:diketogulonate reductase-like aldo/keto reductase
VNEVEPALQETLTDLKVDYLDLYLMHYRKFSAVCSSAALYVLMTSFLFFDGKQPFRLPVSFKMCRLGTVFVGSDLFVYVTASSDIIPKNDKGQVMLDDTPFTETWAEMEKLLASGKVKNIGVSNFTRGEVEELLKTATHKPDVNQIELHPVSSRKLVGVKRLLTFWGQKNTQYLQQKEYCEWLGQQGIHVTQYSPFGNLNPTYESKGEVRVVDHPVIKDIARSKQRY